MTLVTTWCGPGFGMAESIMLTLGPFATTASFMVDDDLAWVIWLVRLESLLVAAERMEDMEKRTGKRCLT